MSNLFFDAWDDLDAWLRERDLQGGTLLTPDEVLRKMSEIMAENL